MCNDYTFGFQSKQLKPPYFMLISILAALFLQKERLNCSLTLTSGRWSGQWNTQSPAQQSTSELKDLLIDYTNIED